MCTYVVILRAGRQVILPKRRKLQIARSWTIRKVGEINVATNDPTNVKLFSTYHLSSISVVQDLIIYQPSKFNFKSCEAFMKIYLIIQSDR